MKFQPIVLNLAILILSSCSASYHQINPHYNSYEASIENNIEIKYKYDILEKSDNKRYDKKAHTYNVELIAIEIINNSDETIYLEKNYGIFSNDQRLQLLPPNETIDKLKQGVAGHLAYLGLTPFLNLSITDPNGVVNTYPIGYVIGPALTLLNMTGAAKSNKKFRQELELYNLLNKPILAGESKKGIIAIDSDEQLPLRIKKIK